MCFKTLGLNFYVRWNPFFLPYLGHQNVTWKNLVPGNEYSLNLYDYLMFNYCLVVSAESIYAHVINNLRLLGKVFSFTIFHILYSKLCMVSTMQHAFHLVLLHDECTLYELLWQFPVYFLEELHGSNQWKKDEAWNVIVKKTTHVWNTKYKIQYNTIQYNTILLRKLNL